MPRLHGSFPPAGPKKRLAPSTHFLGHFQVGSYRSWSLIEGLYTLWKPYRSPIYPKLPTWSFLQHLAQWEKFNRILKRVPLLRS